MLIAVAELVEAPPPFQKREILPHLILVLFPSDWLRNMLVHLIDKPRAVIYHLVHRAVLEELAVLIAVLAVVKAHASVSVGPSVLADDGGLGVHHVPDDLPVLLHHEVELGDEVRVLTVLVKHVMLCAARSVSIPECLSGEVLYLSVVFGLFNSDVHFYFIFCFL